MTKNSSSPLPASGPIGATDIAYQIEAADLILAGTVTEVMDVDGSVSLVSERADSANDRLREAKLDVVRVIAGKVIASSVSALFLEGKVPSQPWMVLRTGQTVLLFLRAVGDVYAPIMPEGSPIRTLPDITPLPAKRGGSATVTYELEQIVLRADHVFESDLIVEASLARVGVRGDVDLGMLGTSSLREPIRRMAWVAIALADEKVAVLSEVEALCAEPASPPADVLQSLLMQQVRKTRNLAAHSELARLSRSAMPELAYVATLALRQLHDPVTLPDLIVALEHPDQQVRYQAVMGLAELEPEAGLGPAFKRYCENESLYLHQWKQWWQNK
jgi:hypothetical protein